jgi:hypothetical protein
MMLRATCFHIVTGKITMMNAAAANRRLRHRVLKDPESLIT